jgi:hypothetical protein
MNTEVYPGSTYPEGNDIKDRLSAGSKAVDEKKLDINANIFLAEDIQGAAENYLQQCFVPIPVRLKGKKPINNGWQNQTLNSTQIKRDFSQPCNIGILLGDASDGLVDIDLDCPEAISIAEQYLPNTKCKFGRPSRRKGHWIYRVANCGERQPFNGPDNDGMLVEYRANRAQTVFPPSKHESGEPISFDDDGDPATVEKEELISAVKKLAAASLIAKHWDSGKRHDLSLALSGALINAGWPFEQVERFIESVCMAADDKEIDDRRRAAADSLNRYEHGQNNVGLPTLSDQLGDRVIGKITEWLEIGSTSNIGHNNPPVDHTNLRCSDIGNAEIFISQHGDNVNFCFDIGSWLVWNGRSWVLDDEQALEQKAEETVRSFQQEEKNIRDSRDKENFLKWVRQSGNRQRIQGMLAQAKNRIGIQSDKLDCPSSYKLEQSPA